MIARDDEWKNLYDELRRALETLGIENAYGDADYWLVDDDYGDTTHKVCIHRKSFLKPVLISVIQKALQGFPRWRVMLQLEFPIAGVPDASSGLIVYPNSIEEHWDRKLVAEIVAGLGL